MGEPRWVPTGWRVGDRGVGAKGGEEIDVLGVPQSVTSLEEGSMGMPFFTWWPHQSRTGTTRQTITLTEGLSDLQITPKRDVIDTFAIDGGRARELLRPYCEVRIVLERNTDRELFRRFNSMINHLQHRGVAAVGLDSQKE